MTDEQVIGVWVHGQSGRMGEVVTRLIHTKQNVRLLGGTTSAGDFDAEGQKVNDMRKEEIDVIVDFSTPTANAALFERLQNGWYRTKGVVIATTSLSDKQLQAWQKLAEEAGIRVLFAPNTSVGIAFLVQATLSAMTFLEGEFDIELVEAHHRGKSDAPSGTAHYIADRIRQQDPRYLPNPHRKGKRQKHEIGMHAVRGGNVFGEHHISFLGDDEEIILSHKALSRDLFGNGAITLARWLDDKPSGFYNLSDVFAKEIS